MAGATLAFSAISASCGAPASAETSSGPPPSDASGSWKAFPALEDGVGDFPVIRRMARMASSFPGMTKSISSGSQLVSTMATMGIPSLRASATAMRSFRGSMMTPCQAASSCSGSRPKSGRDAPFPCGVRALPSWGRGRTSRRSPSSSSWWSRWIRIRIVWKLVSMPPSHR